MSKQKIVLIVIGVIVVAGLIWFALTRKPAPATPISSQTPTSTQTTSKPAATSTPATTKPKTTTTSGNKAVTSAYSLALATYTANGRRIQLYQCHGTPGQLLVKKGYTYMIDNRDNTSHTIRIGTLQTVNVTGYGYLILTASTLGTFNGICDQTGSFQLQVEQ